MRSIGLVKMATVKVEITGEIDEKTGKVKIIASEAERSFKLNDDYVYSSKTMLPPKSDPFQPIGQVVEVRGYVLPPNVSPKTQTDEFSKNYTIKGFKAKFVPSKFYDLDNDENFSEELQNWSSEDQLSLTTERRKQIRDIATKFAVNHNFQLATDGVTLKIVVVRRSDGMVLALKDYNENFTKVPRVILGIGWLHHTMSVVQTLEAAYMIRRTLGWPEKTEWPPTLRLQNQHVFKEYSVEAMREEADAMRVMQTREKAIKANKVCMKASLSSLHKLRLEAIHLAQSIERDYEDDPELLVAVDKYLETRKRIVELDNEIVDLLKADMKLYEGVLSKQLIWAATQEADAGLRLVQQHDEAMANHLGYERMLRNLNPNGCAYVDLENSREHFLRHWKCWMDVLNHLLLMAETQPEAAREKGVLYLVRMLAYEVSKKEPPRFPKGKMELFDAAVMAAVKTPQEMFAAMEAAEVNCDIYEEEQPLPNEWRAIAAQKMREIIRMPAKNDPMQQLITKLAGILTDSLDEDEMTQLKERIPKEDMNKMMQAKMLKFAKDQAQANRKAVKNPLAPGERYKVVSMAGVVKYISANWVKEVESSAEKPKQMNKIFAKAKCEHPIKWDTVASCQKLAKDEFERMTQQAQKWRTFCYATNNSCDKKPDELIFALNVATELRGPIISLQRNPIVRCEPAKYGAEALPLGTKPVDPGAHDKTNFVTHAADPMYANIHVKRHADLLMSYVDTFEFYPSGKPSAEDIDRFQLRSDKLVADVASRLRAVVYALSKSKEWKQRFEVEGRKAVTDYPTKWYQHFDQILRVPFKVGQSINRMWYKMATGIDASIKVNEQNRMQIIEILKAEERMFGIFKDELNLNYPVEATHSWQVFTIDEVEQDNLVSIKEKINALAFTNDFYE